MAWLRQPAPIASACHGGVVGCGNQAWRIAMVGQDSQVSCIAHNYKSLPLEGGRCQANSETDEGKHSYLRMLENASTKRLLLEERLRRRRW